jgi:Domain of unknown function (DUF4386)
MTSSHAPDGDTRSLFRAGGYAGLALGALYVVIVGLYSASGAVPAGDGAAWLAYLDGKTTLWWWIAALSVLTDLFYLPLAAALYVALRQVNRTAMLAGAGMLALFVILDLAVTWPNYAALIVISGDYAAAAGDAQRASLAAAASYPASVLASSLFAVYAIGVPSVGVLIIGMVMLRARFSRTAAWLGVLTGILGVAAVVGPVLVSGLGVLAIVASVGTLIWVMVAGFRLLRLARPVSNP